MIAVHSPRSWGQFNLLGEYGFSLENLQGDTGVPPPNPHPGYSREIGSRQIDENSVMHARNRNSCGTFCTYVGLGPSMAVNPGMVPVNPVSSRIRTT